MGATPMVNAQEPPQKHHSESKRRNLEGTVIHIGLLRSIYMYLYSSITTSSNDPQFIQYIYRRSPASKRFVEVYVKYTFFDKIVLTCLMGQLLYSVTEKGVVGCRRT